MSAIQDGWDQMNLFGGRPPFVRGSDTSEAAADSVAGETGSKRREILGLIREAPNGMTDDEAEERTGWRHQTVSARRRELVLLGLVVDSGRRRKTRSGRAATVWVPSPDPA